MMVLSLTPSKLQPCRQACAPRAYRWGGGIAEVIIATFIVGMMVVAALDAAGQIFKTQKINSDKLTGPGLAQDLLAEVMSMPYADPQSPGAAIGVDSGESASTRTTFDDVDDYNSYTTTDNKARDGSSRTGYTSWAQSATVGFADTTTGAATGTSTDTGLKRITVTVTSSTGTQTQIVGWRFKEGALEQGLPIAATTVNWVGVELRIGSSTRSQFAAAPLSNFSPDAP